MRRDDEARPEFFAKSHLEFPITRLEMCGLVEHRTALPDPICDPRNHFLDGGDRSSEERARLRDIAEESAGTLDTRNEHGLNAKVSAEIECNFPDRQRVGSGAM